MKNKKIALYALLIAIECVLCVISNYVIVGLTNLNLGLIVIAVGAYLLGPAGGTLLGLVNGIFALISPATLTYFMSLTPFWTIIICLSKTAIAGLVAGLIMKANKKDNLFILLLACLSIPLLNTGIFLIGGLTCFAPLYQSSSSGNWIEYLFISVLSINFLIEVIVVGLVSPLVNKMLVKFKGEKLC